MEKWIEFLCFFSLIPDEIARHNRFKIIHFRAVPLVVFLLVNVEISESEWDHVASGLWIYFLPSVLIKPDSLLRILFSSFSRNQPAVITQIWEFLLLWKNDKVRIISHTWLKSEVNKINKLLSYLIWAAGSENHCVTNL